jgi:hypothetical protein
MPTPELKKAMPGKQSLAQRLRANLLNQDLILPFGPPGASATVTHGLAKPDAPLGHKPRTDEWNDNPLVEERSHVADTRRDSTR